MNKFIGIDPGLSGGIAILEENKLLLFPMPLIGDKDYDVQAIKNIFRKHSDTTLVCVERQQSMPGQGLSSTFKTGQGFGILIGVLSALELRYEITTAVRWQRRLFTGLKHGQDTKVSSEIVAKRLFPASDFRKSERSRVASDGLTDAACIAEFARRMFGGIDGKKLDDNNAYRPHDPNPNNTDICLRCGAYLPVAEEECVRVE